MKNISFFSVFLVFFTVLLLVEAGRNWVVTDHVEEPFLYAGRIDTTDPPAIGLVCRTMRRVPLQAVDGHRTTPSCDVRRSTPEATRPDVGYERPYHPQSSFHNTAKSDR